MGIRTRIYFAAAVVMVFMMMSALTSSGLRTDGGMAAYAAGLSVHAAAVQEEGITPMTKDETVYALLNEDGSVNAVYVVNHCKVPKDGTYADFGSYEKMESLTEDIQPRTEDDMILWDLKASYGDFYYQGKLAGAELPWNFQIKYALDGKPVEAKGLAGKSGRVEIALSASPNEAAHPVFRESFTMQIQVPVNLNRASIISADGATPVITGQTNTLTYTVLPGASASYRLVMEVRHFEMDSLNIGISAINYGNTLSAADPDEGFEKLLQGLEGWVKGAQSFKNGLLELSNGMDQLTAGLHVLSEGGSELAKGIQGLSQGFRQFDASVDRVAEGSKDISEGLAGTADSGGSILEGYEQLAQGILTRLPGKEEKEQLRRLAQYAGSSGPYAQAGELAQSLLDQIDGLEQIYQNLAALNGSLSLCMEGVSKLSGEYEGFEQGLTALAQASEKLLQNISKLGEGGRQLSDGLAGLDAGMAEMNGSIKALPAHAQELIDGGMAIKNGMDAAGAAVAGLLGLDGEEEKIVSFAAPAEGRAESVQFIIRTPAVKTAEPKEEAPDKTVTKKSFWEKLAALFR